MQITGKFGPSGHLIPVTRNIIKRESVCRSAELSHPPTSLTNFREKSSNFLKHSFSGKIKGRQFPVVAGLLPVFSGCQNCVFFAVLSLCIPSVERPYPKNLLS